MARGIRSRSSSGSSQFRVAGSTSAVTAALVASVTCSASEPAAAPPESVQAIQVSTVPKHSSPGLGAGALGVDLVEDGHDLGRRCVGGEPDALGLERQAGARRSGGPATRSPGPAACRWRGPRRCSRRAGWRCPRRRRARRRPAPRSPRASAASAMRVGVELDQPGGGRVGEKRRGGARARPWRRGGRRRRGRSRCRRRRPGCWRPVCSHQGGGPNGRARPNLPGLRMPLGSNVAFRPYRTSKPVPRARGKKRERFNPMPWWWLMAAPWAMRGVDHHVPGLAVVALPPFGIALGSAPAEGEVEARPVGIGVRLVGRRGQRPFDPLQRADHLLEERRAATDHGPDTSAVSTTIPARHSGARAETSLRCPSHRSTRAGVERRARRPRRAHSASTTAIVARHETGIGLVEHDQHVGVGAGRSSAPTPSGRRGAGPPASRLGAGSSGTPRARPRRW